MRFEVAGPAKPHRPTAVRPVPAGENHRTLSPESLAEPGARLAVAVLAVLVFLLYSRTIEILAIPGLFVGIGSALLLYSAVSGRLRYLRNTPTALFFFMSAWMVPAGLLGTHPGGSAAILTNLWARSMLAYVVVVCLASDTSSVRRVMAALAWCLPTFSLLSIWMPDYIDGRLMIRASTLANPNDFALFLVVALPFGVWYATDLRHWTILRLAVAVSVFHGLIMLVQTGSRGGMMSAIAVFITAFVLCGRVMRIVLAISVLGAALIGLAMSPRALQQRYMTIVSDDVADLGDSTTTSYALGSKYARRQLFFTSLRVTAEHPLFGIGPGMFPDYLAMRLREQGERADWHQTHNAYTQMSAESGIPAALAYLGVVLWSLKHANRVRKAALSPALRQHAGMSTGLLAAFTGYACCAMFSSIALLPVLPLITGIAVGLEESFRKALPAVEPESAVATAAAGTGSP